MKLDEVRVRPVELDEAAAAAPIDGVSYQLPGFSAQIGHMAVVHGRLLRADSELSGVLMLVRTWIGQCLRSPLGKCSKM